MTPVTDAGVPAPRMPLSSAQQRFWLIDRVSGGSSALHMTERLDISGSLDTARLERAVNAIVARHEVLRTHVAERDGETWQVVEPERHIPLTCEDIGRLSREDAERRVRAAIEDEWREPIDLARGPWMRTRLLRTGESTYVFLRTCHHIAIDGTSQAVFNQELGELYNAFADSDHSPLSPRPVQYADFARWEVDAAATETVQAGVEYWTSHLAGAPMRVGLPTDGERRERSRSASGVHELAVNADVAAALWSLSQSRGTTLHTTLLAAFAAVVARHSGRTDLVIGMPVNHRPDPRFDGAIGCFVNTLAVRFHPDPTQPFDAFLASARRSLVDGYHHRAVPFDRVVGALGLAGTGAAAPIDVVFVQNRPTVAPRLRGLQVTARRDDSRPPRFDLEVHVDAAGGPLVVSWIYDRELFDDWRIAQLAAHYARFLEHVAADPRQPLGDVALVTADERSQLLDGWDPEAPPLPVVAAVSAGV